MSRPRARPRFQLHHAERPEALLERVRARMTAAPELVAGRVYRRTAFITVAPARAHFWSPHLEVQFTDAPEGGCYVQGQFGPHQAIWTTFVIIQLIFGVLALGAAIFAYSKWSLGADATPWLGLFAGMMFGGGFSYGAAYVGQGLGSDQMYDVRAFLDAVLRDDAVAAPADAQG